ncbi:MAG TPA: hypothetical protein VMY37_29975 [Thermoguttaceae bacterium]|nr:hypothetical protein [Thermoguttaceae bacterium]
MRYGCRTEAADSSRRDFLKTGAASISALACCGSGSPAEDATVLRLETLVNVTTSDEPAPIEGATWYTADATGAGLKFRVPLGALAQARYLTADVLLDGTETVVFAITLEEEGSGPQFFFRFALLNQCGARIRMPLALVDMSRWGIDREGAWLKPRCYGGRVRLERVDQVWLKVIRKGDQTARWCLTPLRITKDPVDRVSEPVLPKGPLLDELGQSRIRQWPGKSKSEDEVVARLRRQSDQADAQRLPEGLSSWGGWTAKRIGPGEGFFRTHHDGRRWWLVDPDGYAFWSAGVDCVRVNTEANSRGLETALAWKPDLAGPFAPIYSGGGKKTINYLTANLIRAFGPERWYEAWSRLVLGEVRRLGFNTVGNWSDWEIARKARYPYVRPLSFRPKRTADVYRDFPDVFHADFTRDAADYAAQLGDTADDPALVGYFLMNEPKWAFSSELPATGMLLNTPSCAARRALAQFLAKRYPDDAALSAAWGVQTTFDQVAEGPWRLPLRGKSLDDLGAFSTLMVEKYFGALSAACKAVDPNHLNLGIRYAGVPKPWTLDGMKSFDVFSMNCYREKLPADQVAKIHDVLHLPVIIGEWHFGALDVGLPSSGLRRVRTQEDRGRAYRVYLENAAANPHCVGTHWFTLYDQSALGRFDGENYNIGFLDVCNRPYEPLSRAARTSHELVYQLADGRTKAYHDAPEYLPPVG